MSKDKNSITSEQLKSLNEAATAKTAEEEDLKRLSEASCTRRMALPKWPKLKAYSQNGPIIKNIGNDDEFKPDFDFVKELKKL